MGNIPRRELQQPFVGRVADLIGQSSSDAIEAGSRTGYLANHGLVKIKNGKFVSSTGIAIGRRIVK
jgi:hypothetical protein